LEHAGCHNRILKELGRKSTTCDSLSLSGVRSMSLDRSVGDDVIQPVFMCEGAHQRVSRLESNGTRVPVIGSVTHGDDTSCSMVIDKQGGLFHTVTVSTDGVVEVVYRPSHASSDSAATLIKSTVIVDNLGQVTSLALSPDGKFLYVALVGPVSHGAHWKKYSLASLLSSTDNKVDKVEDPVVITSSMAQGFPGGMFVDTKLNLYASMGEGGVVMFDASGQHIGTISTGGLIATDVALGDDGVLYITTHGCVLRVHTKSVA
jgi:hypothetical protein